MKLIDKDALVAEIERLKIHSEEAIQEFGREGYMDNVLFEQSKIRICETLLSFLNTIEAEEVDLDKELNFVKDAYYYFTSDERSSMKKVAKHFFELGLKAQKGE